jgi:5-methylcytosine-specific restriction endonuclease McrA
VEWYYWWNPNKIYDTLSTPTSGTLKKIQTVPRSPRKNQWWRAAKKLDGHCWYCGCTPEFGELTVDHAKPKSRGGQNQDENLLPACSYCNNLKANLTVSEFRKWVKVRVIRNLMTLGYFASDLSSTRIVFYGEGNDSPFAY